MFSGGYTQTIVLTENCIVSSLQMTINSAQYVMSIVLQTSSAYMFWSKVWSLLLSSFIRLCCLVKVIAISLWQEEQMARVLGDSEHQVSKTNSYTQWSPLYVYYLPSDSWLYCTCSLRCWRLSTNLRQTHPSIIPRIVQLALFTSVYTTGYLALQLNRWAKRISSFFDPKWNLMSNWEFSPLLSTVKFMFALLNFSSYFCERKYTCQSSYCLYNHLFNTVLLPLLLHKSHRTFATALAGTNTAKRV
jgi:hypothetical protein